MRLLVVTLLLSLGQAGNVHAAGPCLPSGPFHLPIESAGTTFSGAFRSPRDTSEARRLLDSVRVAGLRVVINLAGSRTLFQNPDSSFSLERFQQRLARFQGFDFTPWILDGTLIGHTLFDEPHDPTNWGGHLVAPATIDSAAATSRQYWALLPVGVGSPHAYLAAGAPYQHLEYAQPQYTVKRGDVEAWVQSELALAAGDGLQTCFSLNVLSGGPQARPLTPAEVQDYGCAMAREPAARTLLMWKWDEAYFSQPGMAAALDSIAAAGCASHTAGAGPPEGPAGLSLGAPAPNPTRGRVRIAFTLSRPARATLAVYDVVGRRVATLLDGLQAAGLRTAGWDAGGVRAGVYFCRLSAGGADAARAMIVLP
ncbi:MAG: T9SS type A sorting domain-containing protein [Candidatus Eisenbacteria bacterium]|nr:T9SS type A sorting domain-containing protein [Candidatus Eisenbacteria bacterium]